MPSSAARRATEGDERPGATRGAAGGDDADREAQEQRNGAAQLGDAKHGGDRDERQMPCVDDLDRVGLRVDLDISQRRESCGFRRRGKRPVDVADDVGGRAGCAPNQGFEPGLQAGRNEARGHPLARDVAEREAEAVALKEQSPDGLKTAILGRFSVLCSLSPTLRDFVGKLKIFASRHPLGDECAELVSCAR